MCTITTVVHHIDHINKTANTSEGENIADLLDELLFADDQAIIASSEDQLQRHDNKLHETCQDYNMKINIDKTEIMTFARKERTTNIFIENTNLKQVKDFTYMGSIFS